VTLARTFYEACLCLLCKSTIQYTLC